MEFFTQMQNCSVGLSGEYREFHFHGLSPKHNGIFRYDAHPMAILTSAFAYLGSYYAEANPSLQGASLFIVQCFFGVLSV